MQSPLIAVIQMDYSDYVIDGYRLNYRSKQKTPKPDSQILFFERAYGENIIHNIEILDSGDISDIQPKSYREFFITTQKRLLGL